LHVLDSGRQAVVNEVAADEPAGLDDAERFGHQRLLV
jgi:hypothetical protein